ncbi:MAG: aminoglycoside phosphotransferase family protein [Parcubacteria group bacterium]|jgi:aminoglycoside 2''-phosphotransferase
MEKRLRFLKLFSEVSPLKIPVPKYIGENFIAYKKIPGVPFAPTNFKKLTIKEKKKIAFQIGKFLKVLHNFKCRQCNYNANYLVLKKGDYLTCSETITKHFSAKERENFQIKHIAIENNLSNFKKPTTIIHGDLFFNNILWDPKTKKLTGVIDWAESGRSIPALDFFMLADFNNNTNDKFLKDILKSYGAKDDRLFKQIKGLAIIDPMNWFWAYYKEKNAKGMEKMIKKMKRILQ